MQPYVESILRDRNIIDGQTYMFPDGRVVTYDVIALEKSGVRVVVKEVMETEQNS